MQTLNDWRTQYDKAYPVGNIGATTEIADPVTAAGTTSTGSEIPWITICITLVIVGCGAYVIWQHQQEINNRRRALLGI